MVVRVTLASVVVSQPFVLATPSSDEAVLSCPILEWVVSDRLGRHFVQQIKNECQAQLE
jgi:hypothetical protein